MEDSHLILAKEKFRSLFEKEKQAVYYLRQIQVRFEREFFHWVTYQAIIELESEGIIKRLVKAISLSGSDVELHFFTHHSNRYPQRKMNSMAKVIEEYSQAHITGGCGNRAEVLFASSLAMRGFKITGQSVNEYKEKKWTQTFHNLDFIFEKDGIAYGCEIKNKLQYIEKDEMEIKISICKFLELKPLFIMRYSPKTYIHIINRAGGYAMIFEFQIYELGQRYLVEKMREIFGEEKVHYPRALPAGIIDKFEQWHKKQLFL